MAGAFRTTPIKVLEIDLVIPPIELTIELACEGYAHRLHRLQETHPIIKQLPKEWRSGNPPKVTPPLPSHRKNCSRRKPKPTQMESLTNRTYKPGEGECIVPFLSPPWRRTAKCYKGRLGMNPNVKKDKAAKEHKKTIQRLTRNSNNLIMYSDGSMLDAEGRDTGKDTGWGLVSYHKDREVITRRGGLGQKAEVYDAELVGLTYAAVEAVKYTKSHEVIKHIHLYADNSAAVTNVYEPKEQPGQQVMEKFTSLINNFLDGDPERTVHVECCPGHTEVPGNERADEEAKEGA
ncbi:hypothetical protein J132_03034 [Termitomyces sp. J132]|nr:hypothetical protein J132_03034 [Termitomyces sp. J132]